MMDYTYTVWRSHGLWTHSLEVRWTMNTAWTSGRLCTQSGDQMDYVHYLEIRWTMHTVWRSHGLWTHRLEIRWTMHTVWRSVGSVHSLEIRWTMYTARRLDGLWTYSLEIRWTVYTQTGGQLVASTSGSRRWHCFSVFARWLMYTGKLVINRFKIYCSSTIRRP